MEKDNYPARRVLANFIILILLAGTVLGFTFLLFKPYYKGTLNGEFIGYYINTEEYKEYYDKIEKEIEVDGTKITRYILEEPQFNLVFIKPKYAKSINNCKLIENHFIQEYHMYCIKVNGEIKFYVKTKEEADKLTNEIKNEVKKSTEIIIEEVITEDINLLTNEEVTNETKAQVIKENYKISSRGGGIRINTANSKYIWPTISRSISSGFGARWGTTHTGVDIPVVLNSNVFAVDDGTVILATWNGGYGNQVRIQHSNGIVTAYAHCNKLLVKKGQKVKQGDVIALSGSTGNSTGPHLHFEYLINGKFKNPLDYI